MVKPTTTYTWDTNQTNWTQPVVGLRSDGYATDDIPTSANFNYQLNSLGLWVAYFEAVTDALDTLSSIGDITLNIDTDNNSSANALILTHDGATEIFRVAESGNITGYGNIATTGAVTGSNITATNLTDIAALAQAAALSKATVMTPFTDTEVISMVSSQDGNWIRAATGVSATILIAIGSLSDIVTTTLPSDESLFPATAWASVSTAVNYNAVDADGTFAVGVANTGALYTSPASGNYATWTSRTSGTANSLTSVAVGGGYWIAASSSGVNTIRYNDTTDPTDAWSASTSGLDGTTAFVGVAYGAGLFVALSQDDEIITTADPSGAWAARTNPLTGVNWRGLSFDGTRFWGFGDTGALISSTDGITWADATVTGATGRIEGAATLTMGGQPTYAAFEYSTSGDTTFWVGTALGTWTKYPLDVASATVTLPMTYEPTLKRLFVMSNNDMTYSRKIA